MQTRVFNSAMINKYLSGLDSKIDSLERSINKNGHDTEIFKTQLSAYLTTQPSGNSPGLITLVPTLSTQSLFNSVYTLIPHDSYSLLYVIFTLYNTAPGSDEHTVIVAPITASTHNAYTYNEADSTHKSIHYKFMFYNNTVLDMSQNTNIDNGEVVYQLNNNSEEISPEMDIGSIGKMRLKLTNTVQLEASKIDGYDITLSLYLRP